MEILNKKIKVTMSSHGGVAFIIPATKKTKEFFVTNLGGEWVVTFPGPGNQDCKPLGTYKTIVEAYWAGLWTGFPDKEQISLSDLEEIGLIERRL